MTRRYGSKQPTRASQGLAMRLLLVNASEPAFARLTADELVRKFGGKLADAQAALTRAQFERSVRG